MLPQDALSHSVESQEVSISVWVNAKNAGASDDYRYSPLFTAYGNEPSAGSENIWPLFVLQSRGLAQINCNGWTDFTADKMRKVSTPFIARNMQQMESFVRKTG